MDEKKELEIKVNKISFFIALVIWSFGEVAIYFAWEWQKTIPGFLGE